MIYRSDELREEVCGQASHEDTAICLESSAFRDFKEECVRTDEDHEDDCAVGDDVDEEVDNGHVYIILFQTPRLSSKVKNYLILVA